MDIVTARARLRLLQTDDVDWLAREISNPNVHQWLMSPPKPYLRTDAQSFVARHANDACYRVVEFGGQGVGVVSLTRDDSGVFDLGYWLSETAWGQGIMTESAGALVDWHFSKQTTDLWSGWISGNAASRNVLSKLGFQPIGTKQARSEFHDTMVTVEKVHLTHDMWKTLRAAP